MHPVSTMGVARVLGGLFWAKLGGITLKSKVLHLLSIIPHFFSSSACYRQRPKVLMTWGLSRVSVDVLFSTGLRQVALVCPANMRPSWVQH